MREGKGGKGRTGRAGGEKERLEGDMEIWSVS